MRPLKEHWTETSIQCYEHGLKDGAIQLSIFNPQQVGLKFIPNCSTCPVYIQFFNFKCKVFKEVQHTLNTQGPPRSIIHNNQFVVSTTADITHKAFHWHILAYIKQNPKVTSFQIYKHFKNKTIHGVLITPDKIYSALKMGVKKGCLIKEKKQQFNQYYFACDQPKCINRLEFQNDTI